MFLLGAVAGLVAKEAGKAAKWVGKQTGVVKTQAKTDATNAANAAISNILTSAQKQSQAVLQGVAGSVVPVASDAFWSSPKTKAWFIGGLAALAVVIGVIVYVSRRRSS